MSDTELKELYQQAKEKSGFNDIEMIMVILLTIGGKENVEKILKDHNKQDIARNCIKEQKQRRLIDVEKLLDDYAVFGMANITREDVRDELYDLIDNQTTAYDIDKVVEELEKMKTIDGSMKTKMCIKFDEMTINRAIEIVKQGVKEQNEQNSIIEALKPKGCADMPKNIVCNCTKEQKGE